MENYQLSPLLLCGLLCLYYFIGVFIGWRCAKMKYKKIVDRIHEKLSMDEIYLGALSNNLPNLVDEFNANVAKTKNRKGRKSC